MLALTVNLACAGGSYSFQGYSQPEVQYKGNAVKTFARGKRRVAFPDGTSIEITYPHYYLRGVLQALCMPHLLPVAAHPVAAQRGGTPEGAPKQPTSGPVLGACMPGKGDGSKGGAWRVSSETLKSPAAAPVQASCTPAGRARTSQAARASST